MVSTEVETDHTLFLSYLQDQKLLCEKEPENQKMNPLYSLFKPDQIKYKISVSSYKEDLSDSALDDRLNQIASTLGEIKNPLLKIPF
jgi:hypothetical protein